MTTPMLKFHSEDNGFCRVYYKMEGLLYCWQIETYSPLCFEFYRCSSRGEPDYRVKGFQGSPAFSLTPLPPGDTRTGQEFIEWMGNRSKLEAV